jgi:hypothetical protein
MSEWAGSLRVVTAVSALFCAVLLFLALQMRAGHDPALGPRAQAAAAAPAADVRRLLAPRTAEPGAPAGASPSASAPAPAPSPAPAADAVVTRAS